MGIAIRQIVLVAHHLQPVVDQLSQVLGARFCYQDPGVGEFGLENALLVIGNETHSQFLEVVAPTREGTAAGRHLARHGESGYMLLLQTDDISRDRNRFEKLGVRRIWQASYPDITAMHLHPKDIGGAIVSIDQPLPADSWRWAGPDWRTFINSKGIQRVLNIQIAAPDPESLAQRWAMVLGVEASVQHQDKYHLTLKDGTVIFSPGDTETVIGFEVSIPDVDSALDRAHELGLTVRGNKVVIGGVKFSLTQTPQ